MDNSMKAHCRWISKGCSSLDFIISRRQFDYKIVVWNLFGMHLMILVNFLKEFYLMNSLFYCDFSYEFAIFKFNSLLLWIEFAILWIKLHAVFFSAYLGRIKWKSEKLIKYFHKWKILRICKSCEISTSSHIFYFCHSSLPFSLKKKKI